MRYEESLTSSLYKQYPTFLFLGETMINSPSNLPPEVQATADEQLLAVRTPRLIFKLAAMQKKLPSKGGTTLRSSRYDRLPTAVVPLAPDGAPIPSTPLNRTDIDATVSFYGLYSAINQRVFLQNQDKQTTVLYKSLVIDLETEVAFS